MTEASTRVVYRTCPLCEATCGLAITMAGERITRVEGDAQNTFSRGFICPKGAALAQLQDDPDRLRRPMLRDSSAGRKVSWREVSWKEAFTWLDARLQPLRAQHGNNAVAVYLGNPNVHNLSNTIYVKPLIKALGTRNVFSASSVDQMPRHVTGGLVFGHPLTLPVPDIDRTDYLLLLGANPLVSNGSLCTAPDFPARLKAIQARGGRVVVVDPRRTLTARKADEHLFIKPGSDALFLAALAHVLCAEERTRTDALALHLAGLETLKRRFERFSPERVAPVCGVDAATIRRIARELAAAPSACVYGRIGVHTVRFGSLASWLVAVLNVLTGNLNRAGGVMFPSSAHRRRRRDAAPGGRGWKLGRWTSRVKKLPEVLGELPVVTLADEIETAGDGQVRALVTIAGNPLRSTPNSERLEAAVRSLELMVSVDPYLNETTRCAHLVLPPPPPLARSHYDTLFYDLAIRNFAHYSPPTLPLPDGAISESEILQRFAAVAAGQGADADPAVIEQLVLMHLLDGRDAAEREAVSDAAVLAALAERSGAERVLDFLIRSGSYGDGFGARAADGLTLAKLEASPHGIDLGALEPMLPGILSTPSGKIELEPPALVAELEPLAALLDAAQLEAAQPEAAQPDAAQPEAQQPAAAQPAAVSAPSPGTAAGALLMIGRRDLRSNNSWMHNLPLLARGRERCTIQMHPDDAASRDLASGDTARVRSRVGAIELPVEVTSDVMVGVVCVPHGWGHGAPGARLAVAAQHPGANVNVLTDEAAYDPISGNAVLNGIPVEVTAAS